MVAVDHLPEHEQAATILYCIDGYSQREVAEFLDLLVSAVKMRLQRARNRLMQEIIDMVQEELGARRPSRSDRFVQEIRLSLAWETAARDGQLALLELLLVDGMDVNATDAEGRNLLHWAAEQGHLEAIDRLLRLGADADARDGRGRTPRELARHAGQAEAAALLQGRSGERGATQENSEAD
jgi:ankyrin repeat protein